MAKVKQVTFDMAQQERYEFHCPGCGDLHSIPTRGATSWQFNGDVEKPTFTPSLLNRWGKAVDPNWQEPTDPPPSWGWSGTCHLYITDGQIQYLTDCTHHLAGQTIPMEDI